jgi:hypothetical protein
VPPEIINRATRHSRNERASEKGDMVRVYEV